MASNFSIDGMDDLERSIKRLGALPQKSVTKAARAGATIVKKAAKANAPEDSGDLKGAIILKGEHSKTPGKKVFDIEIDPAKSDLFVNISKDGKRSYYPASQEYGYMTKDGGYVPGLHFMRRAITDNAEAVEKKVVEILSEDIDKAWDKG